MRRGAVLALLVAAVALPIRAQAVASDTTGRSAEAGPPTGDEVGGVEVRQAVQHDVSGPLRDAKVASPSAANMKERPLRPLPPIGGPVADGAVQPESTSQVAATTVQGFDGLGLGKYGFTVRYAPPDTVGAVGETQYVQWVNDQFAVFSKTTGAIVATFPKAGNAPWAGFGGGCETNNDGDPIVQYDKLAQRWVLTQFSVSTTPYLQCVAVSTSPDATGSYNRYAFSYGNTQFNDYPKLGVWPDGYYVSYNIFNNGATWAGAKVCALDRASMLTGASATQQCFQLSTSYGGLLPSDVDGTTPPPSGSPNYFLNFGTNRLNLWKFQVDFGTPTNTRLIGPTAVSGVAAFAPACGGGGNCVPQPGTSQKLDSLGDRLMYRLAYRNRAGAESLVVNHSVSVGKNSRSQTTSVRWYQIGVSASGTSSVLQQGTLSAADGTSRWMGSIAQDKVGNIALGYSASSSSVYPSVRFTGRVPSDTAGTMQAEIVAKAGNGSQLQNLSRWGDYSAMTVDPVDDCTFWYTSEYMAANGTFNWNTWINSFKLPGCA